MNVHCTTVLWETFKIFETKIVTTTTKSLANFYLRHTKIAIVCNFNRRQSVNAYLLIAFWASK